jgi:hypothetical protein
VKLTREITVTPAYDCLRVKPCVHGSEACSTQPGRNHGVHNAEMRMHLGTEDHEVVLTVNTGWHLPQTKSQRVAGVESMGSSVAWHSRRDIPNEETLIMSDPKSCPRGWEMCYSAVSYSLTAGEGALLLVTEGTGAVWSCLAELYNDRFGKTGDTEDE